MKLKLQKMKNSEIATEILKTDYLSSSVKYLMRYVISAMLGGLAIALKVAFAFLPNVEFVTFILMFSVLFMSWDIGFIVINVFCALNMLIFGVADWSIMYFIIFNFYGLIILLLRRICFKWWWIFIIINALMGYCFGALYAIQTALWYGPSVGIAYWITGLWFDFIHGTANAIITLVLFIPILKLYLVLRNRYPFLFNKQFLKLKIVEKNKKSSS